MKKTTRFFIVFLLFVSISLGCKLAKSKAIPTAVEPATLVKSTTTSLTATDIPLSTITSDSADSLPVFTQPPQSTNPLSAGDPYSAELGNSGYDVQKYKLQLTLDPATTFIEARVTITATITAQIEQVSLDFIGFSIHQVTFMGHPTEYQRLVNKLLVDLPVSLSSDKECVLEISYSGEPVIEASAYFPFGSHIGLINPDGESLFAASEPDGSRYWFPCNDHPRDKATYRFELTVPVGMTGVANGKLIDDPIPVPDAFSNGWDGELYIWEHNYPVATAFVTVAVAKYERVEGHSPRGIPLRSYVFPEDQERFQSYQTRIGEMIDWLSEKFGPYPFEEFGFVMVKGLRASLETQTMVLLDNTMLNEEVLVHEIAHMWFGDWVSLDSWGDIWRSEGFATYTQLLWSTRNQPEHLELTIREMADYITTNPSGYPLNFPPRAEMFGRDSYNKGAVVAHALREKMGDDAFYEGLRVYFERYGGDVASHAEFQSVMEAAAGFKLDEFFQNWFK